MVIAMKYSTREMVIISLLPFLAVTIFSLNFMYFAADEYTYMNNAHSFLRGSVESADITRFPFFPVTLSGMYFIFGEADPVSNIFVIVLGVITILSLFFIVRKMFDENKAFWSSLILSTSPLFVFFGTRVLTEMLFMLLLLLCIYFTYLSRNNQKYFILIGVFAALLFLTRYVGLYFFIIFIVFFIMEKKARKIFSKWTLLGILAFLFVLSPYMFLNYSITENPMGLVVNFFNIAFGITQGTFGWPDKIPSFFLVLPFILLFASPLLWQSINNQRKKLLKEKILIFTISILVVTTVMELFYLNSTPLLRYLIVIVPFLSVLASFGITGPRMKQLAIILVAVNLFASFYLVYQFNTGYQKHKDYTLVGTYVAGTCDTYNSNIDFVIFHYKKSFSIDLNASPECVIFSKYGSSENRTLSKNYVPVFLDGVSEKIMVGKII